VLAPRRSLAATTPPKEEIDSTQKAKRYKINLRHGARGMLLKLLADEEKKQQEQQGTGGRPETIGTTAREFHSLPQLGATDRKSWKPPHCELCGGVMKVIRRVSPPDAQVAISLYRCERCGHTVSLPEQEEA
jgi:hypothetical protein